MSDAEVIYIMEQLRAYSQQSSVLQVALFACADEQGLVDAKYEEMSGANGCGKSTLNAMGNSSLPPALPMCGAVMKPLVSRSCWVWEAEHERCPTALPFTNCRISSQTPPMTHRCGYRNAGCCLLAVRCLPVLGYAGNYPPNRPR